jgi:putative toxin-antitoxin system antitoxin component (TIGR02293 family)
LGDADTRRTLRYIEGIHRNSDQQQFSAYNKVVNRAVDVFGSELKATHWLSRQNPDFDGKSPLEVLTDSGFNPTPILDTLGKIEHGIYF